MISVFQSWGALYRQDGTQCNQKMNRLLVVIGGVVVVDIVIDVVICVISCWISTADLETRHEEFVSICINFTF